MLIKEPKFFITFIERNGYEMFLKKELHADFNFTQNVFKRHMGENLQTISWYHLRVYPAEQILQASVT